MKIDIQIHLEELQRRITSHLRSCIENHERDRIIKLCGISRTGKTQLAISFAQNTKCSMYFSFRGLDHLTALAQFKRTFSEWGDLSSATSWKEAFQCLVPFFKKHYTRIVLDDLEHCRSVFEVISALEQLSVSLTDMKNLFLLPCRCEDSFGKHELFKVPLYTSSDIKNTLRK